MSAAGRQCRAIVLGHIRRGGTPTARDRYLALQFGAAACSAVKEGKFGVMVARRGTGIVPVALTDVAKQLKTVPEDPVAARPTSSVD